MIAVKHVTLAACGLVLTTLLAAAQPAGFDHFISIDRDGVLKDGPSVFRYVGANMPEVTHIRTDWDLVQNNRFRLPTTDEIDWMVDVAAQANFKVIRTWCFPSHLQPENPPDTWYFTRNADGLTVTLNETDFRLFDYFLERCAQKGIRAQVPFVYLYQPREWADAAGDPHPQLLDFVRQLLNRVNTRTGVRYRDDRTIYCWQSGNESKPSVRWISKLAAYVKSLDHNHLFMDGRWGAVDTFESYLKDATLSGDPNIDIVSFHTYGPPANGWTMTETMRRVNERLRAQGKALDIGEIGPATPVETLREYLDTVVEQNIAGVSWWSWKGARAKGGYTQWNSRRYAGNDDLKWPGFVSELSGVSTEKAKIDLLCAAAYAIDGGVRPDTLPRPTPAKLQPITDVGHISWIPGTGEQTADIERSTSPAGGFAVIAAGHETFRGSTYDLFCDTGANVGESYYYRVRSRNAGGVAAYSNIVGPVRVTHRWFVDDLWDFRLTRAHTAGAFIEAHYDLAPYHADLAVLKATGDGESVTYGTEQAVSYLRVIANNDTDTLTVEGSADGQAYEPIILARTVYPPLHPEFAGHPRVLYEGDVPVAKKWRYLRINFGARDVISRVEIAATGPGGV
jgi:mannan endo-1,4-beta-mannosidase